MTVKLLCDYPPYKAGNLFTSDANTEAGLVAQHVAQTDLTGGTTYLAPGASGAQGWIPLNANYTLQVSDNNKSFAALSAITITVPAGMFPRPTVGLMPPPSGNLTLAGQVSGTRTRAANPAGVCLSGYPESDGYGLSGV